MSEHNELKLPPDAQFRRMSRRKLRKLQLFVSLGLISVAFVGLLVWLRAEYATLGRSLTKSPLFDGKVALFDPNATGGAVVMLGDSLTESADWNFLLKRSDIVNAGIPGETSFGLLQRVSHANIAGKTIFQMIGVNDLSHRFAVRDVADNIRQIVGILSPKNKVFLQTTLLTRDPNFNAQIKELDAIEAYICAEHNACTLIDLNAVIAPSGVLGADASIDVVHVNHATYAKWAGAISPYFPRYPRNRSAWLPRWDFLSKR